MGRVVVLISADIEWQAVRQLFPQVEVQSSPLGAFINSQKYMNGRLLSLVYFHGGWGKIAAAASTQYCIDRWKPALIVNLGTCGGFEGEIQRGEIVLVERTLVYDILEQIGDSDEHIAHYATDIDLDWLGDRYPHIVRRSLMVSGDRDLVVDEIPELKSKYGAIAGDWESGAIAFVAKRNGVRCLILRGVTDLVSSQGGEAYQNSEFFRRAAVEVMCGLVQDLPGWLALAYKNDSL